MFDRADDNAHDERVKPFALNWFGSPEHRQYERDSVWG